MGTARNLTAAVCVVAVLGCAAHRPLSRDVRGAGDDTAIGVVVLGALVGSVACTLACPSDSTVEETSEITAGVLGIGLAVGLVGLIVWGIVSCSGKWGQSGCHD